MKKCFVLLSVLFSVASGFVSPSQSRRITPSVGREIVGAGRNKKLLDLIPTSVDVYLEPPHQQRSSYASTWSRLNSLSTGNDDENDNDDDSNLRGVVPLQTLFYILNSLSFAAISGIILFMPDKTNTKMLSTKLGGVAGFAMAGLLTNMLAGASQRRALQYDVYKKLNLGLLAFCVTGLAAVPGEAAFTPLAIPATLLAGFMSMARLIGGVTAFMGWRAGVSNDPVEELMEGVKKTQESMDLEKESKGNLYKWSAIAVAFGVANSMLEIAKSKLEFDISLQVSTISRLFLVLSMLLTLKDASEQDLLSKRMFIQMNFMIAAWAMLVGLGQGIQRYSNGFAFDFSRAKMILCAIPFFFKAMKGRKDSETASLPPAA